MLQILALGWISYGTHNPPCPPQEDSGEASDGGLCLLVFD